MGLIVLNQVRILEQGQNKQPLNYALIRKLGLRKQGKIDGRTLGYVYLGDVCVNKELLKQGMAWH